MKNDLWEEALVGFVGVALFAIRAMTPTPAERTALAAERIAGEMERRGRRRPRRRRR